MSRAELPASAAWRHEDVRQGFESVFVDGGGSLLRIEGCTTAVEDGVAWVVGYELAVDRSWITRSARVWSRWPDGRHQVRLAADPPGRWTVDGVRVPDLDDCVDVDLESSACTNTLPVHRLQLAVGDSARSAPAAFVRAPSLEVERLEQSYARLPDEEGRLRYDYQAPVFDIRVVLEYDRWGLVTAYPGLATRVH